MNIWQQIGTMAVIGVWGAALAVVLARRFAPQVKVLADRARRSRLGAALAVVGLGALVAYAGTKYTIVYDKVAADATGTMTNEMATVDEPYVLTSNAFNRVGYTFTGWSTNEADKVDIADGATVTNLAKADGTSTLKAVWKGVPLTLKIPEAKEGYSYVVSNETTGAALPGEFAEGTNTYKLAYGDEVEVYFTLADGYVFVGNPENPMVIGRLTADRTVDIDELPTATKKNKASEALAKAFEGLGTVSSDGEGGCLVTLTDDADGKTVELAADLGKVTLDLSGHFIAGANGANGYDGEPGKDGKPALRVDGGGEVGAGPLQLTIVGPGSLIGGSGGRGIPGGKGAAAIENPLGVSVTVDASAEVEDGKDAASCIEVTQGVYLNRPLSDFGVSVPGDVDYANGDKVAVKLEGMAAGLKLVATPVYEEREVKGKPKKVVVDYVYSIQGVPTAELLFGAQTAYARITVTYKDKTKGEKGKLVQLQPVRMQVAAPHADEFPDGRLAQDYAPFSVSDIWPEVEKAPKEWSFKGWPSGIKYTTKLVTKKNKDKTVTTNALPYQIYGKPTKAGVYTVTATHSHKIGGKSVKELFYATLTVWGTEPDEESVRYTHQAYVTLENIQLPKDVKKVSGLPSGLKFTTKQVTTKGTVVALPYQIYGTPTKPGVFAVTVTTPNPENPKKTVGETFLWQITPGENDGALAYLATDDWTAPKKDETIAVMQGAMRDWSLAVPEGAKVTASGLPAGLKLVQDKTTKAYSFAGVPTKAGEYVVTIKTVRNGVTVTERVAIHVAANAYTGSHVGVTSADCTRASMTLDVTVAAAGGVTATLVENTVKTTAKAKNFETDNETVRFTLPKNKKVLGSVDRELVVNFASNTVTVAGEEDFALWQKAVPSDPEEVRTFVLEDTAGARESYACVTAAYDAKKMTYALTGSLEDGTKVKAAVSAITDGEREAFAPVLVTDKAKTVRLLWLTAEEGGRLLDVREDGEPAEDVELAETEPFKKADVSKKKFNVLTADNATEYGFGGGRPVTAPLSDQQLKAAVDATGSLAQTFTDADGWTVSCLLVPYRDEGGALRFRGMATKTKKKETTVFGGVARTLFKSDE